MVDAPRFADLLGGKDRRRAFLDYWGAMGRNDWRDLIAVSVLRHLPLDWASEFGARSGAIRGPGVYTKQDIRARKNLARLRPDLPEPEREAMLAARWRCVGRTFAEFAVLDRLIARRVTVEGIEHLEAAKARGRGCIVLTLHLGNWETLAIGARLGFPISSFYQPRDTRAREHISQATRRRLGVDLLPPGLAGIQPALQALAKQRLVAIFVDEELGGVVHAPLFGRPARANGNLALAARLARRSGAPILVAYDLREAGARFRTVVTPDVRLAPGSGVLGDVAQLNAVIEPIVLAHLDQWYFLHEKLD